MSIAKSRIVDINTIVSVDEATSMLAANRINARQFTKVVNRLTKGSPLYSDCIPAGDRKHDLITIGGTIIGRDISKYRETWDSIVEHLPAFLEELQTHDVAIPWTELAEVLFDLSSENTNATA